VRARRNIARLTRSKRSRARSKLSCAGFELWHRDAAVKHASSRPGPGTLPNRIVVNTQINGELAHGCQWLPDWEAPSHQQRPKGMTCLPL
jgi:hypothetical protein